MPQLPSVSDVRARPAFLRALGLDDPPMEVEAGGQVWHRREVFKHDSWAATALYEGPGGRIVCKFHRRQPVLVLPMGWIGRWLARREAWALRQLKTVESVPDDCGPVVVGGRVLPYAVAHVFVPGRPLQPDAWVDDAFFARLRSALEQMHALGLAYVDLNKRENIVVDEEGRPHLIDFQIHFGVRPGWLRSMPVNRAVLRMLQQSDDYHLAKHWVQHRPDQLSEQERDLDRLRPSVVRFWRRVQTPLRQLRRKLLVRMKVRCGAGEACTELDAEQARRLGGRA